MLNILLQAATCTDMKDKLMTLIVGAEETHFTWFHEILSFHSPFFAGAIKYSCYDESKNNTVRMPEDSPDVVREVGGYGLGSDNPSIDPWTYWDLMVDIYIFGNKYGIPRLQNVAINEIISLFTDQFAFPRAATIDKVYELTPSGVSLRMLITDIVVLSHDNVEALIDGQSRFGEGFHPDFITDLVKRLYRAAIDDKGFKEQRLERSQWGQIRRCMYHVSEVAARSNGQRSTAYFVTSTAQEEDDLVLTSAAAKPIAERDLAVTGERTKDKKYSKWLLELHSYSIARHLGHVEVQ
ncbi:hypothetical protein D6D27_04125 [Aureobasidium pullulans]|nr:hypothetical protein D6D27_04125 [Aureobasidium pullulans]